MTNQEISSTNGKTSRLFFIDHLRAALVILVAFFLLAGYFTPGSYDRKGSGSFLKERLIRLGIPLLLFYFVLSPISNLGLFLMPASLTGITTPLTWDSFWQMYPDLLGLGPLWFVAMLLIFSFGYAGWRMLAKKRTSTSERKSSVPSYLGIGVFILALALISYLVRMYIPIGKSVLPGTDVYPDRQVCPWISYPGLPATVHQFLRNRYDRIPARLAAKAAWKNGHCGICGGDDRNVHVVLAWLSQFLESIRECRPANTPVRLRDMAVCRICVLGLDFCCRHVLSSNNILPPLLQ